MAVQTRRVLLDELMGRLHAMDDRALAELNAALAAGRLPAADSAPETIPEVAPTREPLPGAFSHLETPETIQKSAPRGSTRRAFLTCATVLGGAGAAATATGGYALWRVTQSEPVQNTLNSEHLQNLLRLYKALDDVQIDEIAAGGIVQFSRLLHSLGRGALLLKGGIEQAEEVLAGFEQFATRVRDDLSWIEGIMAGATGRMQQLQADVNVLAEWLNPAFEAVGNFADRSFGLLPDTVEVPVRNAWTQIREVAAGAPGMMAQLQQRLLPALREQGFATVDADDALSVEKRMIEPVAGGLLTPLKQHLEEFAALAEAWQTLLAEPVQQAVDERLALRQHIIDYRAEHDLM